MINFRIEKLITDDLSRFNKYVENSRCYKADDYTGLYINEIEPSVYVIEIYVDGFVYKTEWSYSLNEALMDKFDIIAAVGKVDPKEQAYWLLALAV